MNEGDRFLFFVKNKRNTQTIKHRYSIVVW